MCTNLHALITLAGTVGGITLYFTSYFENPWVMLVWVIGFGQCLGSNSVLSIALIELLGASKNFEARGIIFFVQGVMIIASLPVASAIKEISVSGHGSLNLVGVLAATAALLSGLIYGPTAWTSKQEAKTKERGCHVSEF